MVTLAINYKGEKARLFNVWKDDSQRYLNEFVNGDIQALGLPPAHTCACTWRSGVMKCMWNANEGSTTQTLISQAFQAIRFDPSCLANRSISLIALLMNGIRVHVPAPGHRAPPDTQIPRPPAPAQPTSNSEVGKAPSAPKSIALARVAASPIARPGGTTSHQAHLNGIPTGPRNGLSYPRPFSGSKGFSPNKGLAAPKTDSPARHFGPSGWGDPSKQYNTTSPGPRVTSTPAGSPTQPTYDSPLKSSPRTATYAHPPPYLQPTSNDTSQTHPRIKTEEGNYEAALHPPTIDPRRPPRSSALTSSAPHPLPTKPTFAGTNRPPVVGQPSENSYSNKAGTRGKEWAASSHTGLDDLTDGSEHSGVGRKRSSGTLRWDLDTLQLSSSFYVAPSPAAPQRHPLPTKPSFVNPNAASTTEQPPAESSSSNATAASTGAGPPDPAVSVDGLLRQRSEICQRIATLASREKELRQELAHHAMPVPELTVDPHPEIVEERNASQSEIYALRTQLETESEARRAAELALEEEQRRRERAEGTLADVRRESNGPFVVPALLDAFAEISRFTGELLASDHKAMV
ncbi:hypothetical protein DAEQUDRAFT_810545 [Daedalea quercina L-15889]|uniref:Uncharacterized protein n=1 Tax=Daedalea quercina L-15889 TaxID=1314783 RepID=A0A165RF41_9APHY|nr:hypothetical protein DAEQUDRAFT_810545 [Daedalea quercina L-15889]